MLDVLEEAGGESAFCDTPGLDALGAYSHGLASPANFYMNRLYVG